MASRIITKKGSGAPLASDLVHGELAVDTVNKRLYTEDSGGTVIEVGINPAAEITANAGIALPDNQKATFGASDDLQIYHDGSNSYIDDAGANRLYIRGSRITFDKYTGETMVDMVPDGAVNLFYDNSNVFQTTSTGVNVTGTVTADGLTVDGNAVIDGGATDNTVLTLDSGTPNTYLKITDSNSTNGAFIGATTNDLNLYPNNTLSAKFSAGGDISFYEDTGTTAKFFWDASAERLGLGTTSPTGSLDISTDFAFPARLNSSAGETILDLNNTSSTGRQYYLISGGASGSFAGGKFGIFDATAAAERLTVDSSGNVGIGQTAPYNNSKLDVVGSIISTSQTIGTYAANNAGFDYAAGTKVGRFFTTSSDATGGHMTFITGAGGGSERMRLDASGNLLVGRTSVGTTGTGHSIRGGDSAVFAREGGEVVIIARNTNNGQAVRFDCQGTNGVGSIDVTTTATSYVTSSDQRLKENITDANDAGDKIDAIQVRQYDWKADGSHQDYGMIAQELMTVAPEAVSGDPESDEMMGVDYSKLVPMLIKEIQSLRARVAQLEGAN